MRFFLPHDGPFAAKLTSQFSSSFQTAPVGQVPVHLPAVKFHLWTLAGWVLALQPGFSHLCHQSRVFSSVGHNLRHLFIQLLFAGPIHEQIQYQTAFWKVFIRVLNQQNWRLKCMTQKATSAHSKDPRDFWRTSSKSWIDQKVLRSRTTELTSRMNEHWCVSCQGLNQKKSSNNSLNEIRTRIGTSKVKLLLPLKSWGEQTQGMAEPPATVSVP